MEAKHSPGPWALRDWATYDKDGALEACGCQVVDADRNAVSACTMEGASESEEADSRLIAAAPELLEAVRNLAQIVYTQNGNLHDDINTLLAQAKAAIAKATGSAQ